jgi:hypothetical protein
VTDPRKRVCFISILRLIQLVRANSDASDFTYTAAELSYLTAVEVNGAIVCACVMTLKPLLARFFPRLFLSSSSRGGSSTTASGTSRRVGGYHYRNRRGPPTIGSVPSKGIALASVDREVWSDRGDVVVAPGVVHHHHHHHIHGGGRRRVWVDGGYVEIEDGDDGGSIDRWRAEEVELADRGAAAANGSSTVRAGGKRPVVPPVESGKVRVDTEVRVQVFKADGK